MSGLQKFSIITALVLLMGAVYVVFQTRGDMTVGVTLTTNPNLEDGLVAHYTFDGPDIDWGSTTAEVLNRTGNNHHGDAANMSATNSPVEGVLGQAIDIDTSGSDRIDIPDHDDLSFTTGANDTAFSVAFWVLPETASADFGVVKEPGGDLEWAVLASGGIIYFEQYDLNIDLIGRTVSLPIGEWIHLVCTYDGSETEAGMNIYIDAVESDDGSDSSGVYDGVTNSTGLVRINGTDAIMDDVRIYNRALSAAEISRLYDLGNTTRVAETITSNPTLEDGLVGHWTLDGSDVDWSSTTAEIKDRSGQGNHGNAASGVSASKSVAVGPIGQALSFDGVSDHVRLTSTDGMDFNSGTGPFSIGMWLRLDTLEGGENFARPLEFGNCSAAPSYLAFSAPTSTRRAALSVYDSDNTPKQLSSVSNAWEVGEWFHAVAVYDRDNDEGKMYVNGVQSGATTDLASQTGTIDCNPVTANASIGGWGTSFNYAGYVDDVRVYNRALSAEEVQRLYGLGATTHVSETITSNPTLEDGLVGHWTFDGPDVDWGSSTAEISDRAGQNSRGNATNLTVNSVTEGVLGQGLLFDGTNDYIILPEDSDLQPTDAISVALWLKADTLTNFDSPIGHTPLTWGDGFGLLYNTGNLQFYVLNWATAKAQIPFSDTSSWHHVAGTWNGTTMQVYVDGVAGTPDTNTGTISYTDTSYIGAFDDPTQYNWDGSIDDVRMYNRALSAAEVQRLYDLGR